MNCLVYMALRPFQCAPFFGWVKAFKARKFSVEDDTRHGRLKTSVTKANIAAVKIVVKKQNARLSVKDIASCTGISAGLGGSVGCAVRLETRRSRVQPRRGRQHSFVEIDHEIFSTVIVSLPLIQEGQLSVSGERMCTILVNRLED